MVASATARLLHRRRFGVAWTPATTTTAAAAAPMRVTKARGRAPRREPAPFASGVDTAPTTPGSAGGAGVLPLHPGRAAALLDEPGVIGDEHPTCRTPSTSQSAVCSSRCIPSGDTAPPCSATV